MALSPDSLMLSDIRQQEGDCVWQWSQRMVGGCIWGQMRGALLTNRAAELSLCFHTHRWAALRLRVHSLSSWETSSSEEFSLRTDQRSFGPSGLL